MTPLFQSPREKAGTDSPGGPTDGRAKTERATGRFALCLLMAVLISPTKSIPLSAQFWRFKRPFAGAGSVNDNATLPAPGAIDGRSSVDSAYKQLGATDGHLKLLQSTRMQNFATSTKWARSRRTPSKGWPG
jgi:hypothetical protein